MSQSAVRNPFTPEQSVSGAMNQEAIITRLIGRTFTHTVVKVIAVDAGGTGENGFVDVINLVQQLDGNNEGIPNQPIYRLPYFRLQGGLNAVVIDPRVGDLGLAAFAMRDITKVKTEKTETAPPSRRQYDQSDGLYIGGFLNGAPKQWIEFLEDGINVVATGDVNVTTPATVNVDAGGDINATTPASVNIDAGGDINATTPASVNIDAGGDINATCTNLSVACSAAKIETSSLDVDSPTSTFTGAITALSVTTAGGAITPTGVEDAGGTMSDLRDAYNGHAHTSEEPGSPTSTTDKPV